MRKLSLIVLMIILILLNGCSSRTNEAINPPLVKTKFVSKKIPITLLEPVKAPDPEMLKNVRVCRDKLKAKLYVKKLLLAWYQNKKKLESIQRLEDLNDTAW